MVFIMSIIGGINSSISCVAAAVCWISAVMLWNCLASWSNSFNESNRDSNEQHMAMSNQCLYQKISDRSSEVV